MSPTLTLAARRCAERRRNRVNSAPAIAELLPSQAPVVRPIQAGCPQGNRRKFLSPPTRFEFGCRSAAAGCPTHNDRWLRLRRIHPPVRDTEERRFHHRQNLSAAAL